MTPEESTQLITRGEAHSFATKWINFQVAMVVLLVVSLGSNYILLNANGDRADEAKEQSNKTADLQGRTNALAQRTSEIADTAQQLGEQNRGRQVELKKLVVATSNLASQARQLSIANEERARENQALFQRTAEVAGQAQRLGQRAQFLAQQNQKRVNEARQLGIRIQQERANNILRSCRQTNSRNKSTKMISEQFPPGPQRDITNAFIDAILPEQNCGSAVKKQVKAAPPGEKAPQGTTAVPTTTK